jgi:hypothetical protein
MSVFLSFKEHLPHASLRRQGRKEVFILIFSKTTLKIKNFNPADADVAIFQAYRFLPEGHDGLLGRTVSLRPSKNILRVLGDFAV